MFKGKLLGKSFDPEKCKRQLKLAVARIKILRNKRGALVKQLRSDIAHQLELGQDQTALLQVENVIREEKVVEAYDIVIVFSEHIVPNVHAIEAQRNCPTNLKEAVASVIFASGRCGGDIPELQMVSKCLETKYGRKFVADANQLRPNCGVYLTLIEKLSTGSPEGKSKLRTLIDIAKEHDVTWDPKAYREDLDPLGDIPGGHSYTEGTSSKAELHIKHEGVSDEFVTVRVESSRNDAKQHHLNISVTLPNNPRSSGVELIKQVDSGDGKIDLGNGGVRNRRVEFKDATSAAQAAAEAAERASMAAREAVELSIRGKFNEKLLDKFNEMNVKEQQNKSSSSYDCDVLSTNSYGLTEDGSNADLANEEGSSEEDHSKFRPNYKEGMNPNISPRESPPYYDSEDSDDRVGKKVWDSAVSRRTKK